MISKSSQNTFLIIKTGFPPKTDISTCKSTDLKVNYSGVPRVDRHIPCVRKRPPQGSLTIIGKKESKRSHFYFRKAQNGDPVSKYQNSNPRLDLPSQQNRRVGSKPLSLCRHRFAAASPRRRGRACSPASTRRQKHRSGRSFTKQRRHLVSKVRSASH